LDAARPILEAANKALAFFLLVPVVFPGGGAPQVDAARNLPAGAEETAGGAPPLDATLLSGASSTKLLMLLSSSSSSSSPVKPSIPCSSSSSSSSSSLIEVLVMAAVTAKQQVLLFLLNLLWRLNLVNWCTKMGTQVSKRNTLATLCFFEEPPGCENADVFFLRCPCSCGHVTEHLPEVPHEHTHVFIDVFLPTHIELLNCSNFFCIDFQTAG
jgi:hypothetical protein